MPRKGRWIWSAAAAGTARWWPRRLGHRASFRYSQRGYVVTVVVAAAAAAVVVVVAVLVVPVVEDCSLLMHLLFVAKSQFRYCF